MPVQALSQAEPKLPKSLPSRIGIAEPRIRYRSAPELHWDGEAHLDVPPNLIYNHAPYRDFGGVARPADQLLEPCDELGWAPYNASMTLPAPRRDMQIGRRSDSSASRALARSSRSASEV